MPSFPSIRIEGGLLGPELLDQVIAADVPGQKPADFGLEPKRNLTDEIAAVFADSRALWGVFKSRLTRLPENDLATTVTRDQWALPFLALLGYQARYNSKAFEVDGQTFAVSHRAGEAEDTPPIHVVGAGQKLGTVPPSGRPRMAPHSLVQEYLNRTEHVWGIVTNGLTLRLLRDSTLVRRQAYIEFDLQAIFEEQRFHDFAALYRLIHRSRLPRGMADANECLLEKYYAQTVEQGGRVREHLRDGVEECLKLLGNGFLTHKDNDELRQKLNSKQLTPAQFYRQLFRIVYRFLFLLVSEDRGLISPNPIYRDHYGIARLRRMLDVQAAWTDHADLWLSLRTLWKLFGDDKLAKILDLAPLNGELFATQTLDDCALSNRDLLHAFWYLAYYQERAGAPARRVNYSALDVEELGSVYESLLEFHPDVATDAAAKLHFDLIFGSERKTTGSFYTPPELVNELIESALMPVVRQRLAAAAILDKRDGGTKHQQAALLSLKIIDIACGSGHMLLAAARRVGKELAKLRTGEDEPAPERVRESIRDVISHCIYGVDRNPLAVDLCRVALWLESHTAGKPLTFLDHRIRCGDSLVGVFDLGVLPKGIPDKAFDPCEGDEKSTAKIAVKQNREERRGAQDLFAVRDSGEAEMLTRHSRDVDAIPDDSPELIRRKKELFEASHRDPAWLRQKQACDLWTAAYFQTLSAGSVVITSAALADYLDGRPIDARLNGCAGSLAIRQPFFHWPLEFPEVFAAGGFDVVLSNPPWERIKLTEKEFFETRDSRIAGATSIAVRKQLLTELQQTNPSLHAEFTAAVHDANCLSKFLRQSGRYPLTATGDINTYAVFAETSRRLLATDGRAGVILPTGIATDATCQKFFSDLIRNSVLASLFDFENSEAIFPAVHRSYRFSLMTIAGQAVPRAEYAFYLSETDHLRRPGRRFFLTQNDIALFNPNSLTCPVFHSQIDAELLRKIFSHVPVLYRDDATDANTWDVSFLAMFHMTNDSSLMKTRAQLESKELQLGRFNDFTSPSETWLPVYEGKMVDFYNHRAATIVINPLNRIRPAQPELATFDQLADPEFVPLPLNWAISKEVEKRTPKYWKYKWFPSFKRVTAATNHRTVVGAIIPYSAVSYSLYCALPKVDLATDACLFSANLFALVFDYAVRQKTTQPSLPLFVVEQSPVLPLAAYGLTRDELRYILDPADVHGPDFPGETFRVLKEKETAKFGEYRTRRLVLEAWDKLSQA